LKNWIRQFPQLGVALRGFLQSHREASGVTLAAMSLIGYLFVQEIVHHAAETAATAMRQGFDDAVLSNATPTTPALTQPVRDAIHELEEWERQQGRTEALLPTIFGVAIGLALGLALTNVTRAVLVQALRMRRGRVTALHYCALCLTCLSIALVASAASSHFARLPAILELPAVRRLGFGPMLMTASAVFLFILALQFLFMSGADLPRPVERRGSEGADRECPRGYPNTDASTRLGSLLCVARSRLRVAGLMVAALGLGDIAAHRLWREKRASAWGPFPHPGYWSGFDFSFVAAGIAIIVLGLAFAVFAPMFVQHLGRHRDRAARGCCQRCGRQLELSALSCIDCGELVACAYCQHPLAPTQPNCVECGKLRLQPMSDQ
jgi:hypothetical protein